MGECRSVFEILIGKPKGKRPIGGFMNTLEDDTSIDFKDPGLKIFPGDLKMLYRQVSAFHSHLSAEFEQFRGTQGRGAPERGTPREWDGGGARRRAGQHD